MKRLEDYEVGEKGGNIANRLHRADDVPKLKYIRAEVSKEVALGIMTAFHAASLSTARVYHEAARVCDNKEFLCFGKVDRSFMRGSVFLESHDGRFFIWTTVIVEV